MSLTVPLLSGWTEVPTEEYEHIINQIPVYSIFVKISIFHQQQEWQDSLQKILYCILQIDVKTSWSYFSTPETLFVDVSFILLVTWHCWLQGILCLITKATSSWYKHHWTLLEYTPSHLSRCNNHINDLVQTWGVKMYTDTAISLDSCPIRPTLTCACEHGFVYVCACVSLQYVHVCLSVRG